MFLAAWVKMKLASQSQEFGADWDEEPQLRMEGVEAELLSKTREPAPAKVQTSSAWGNAALGGFRGFYVFPGSLGWFGHGGDTRLQMSQRKVRRTEVWGEISVAVGKCPKLLVLGWLEEFFAQNVCGGADGAWEKSSWSSGSTLSTVCGHCYQSWA